VTPAAVAADRNAEVRATARAWERRGLIAAPVRAALDTRHPDDRVRLGPALRVLVFVMTFIGVWAVFGFVFAVLSPGDGGAAALAAVLGGLLAALTEWQLGPLRRSQAGAEAATALASALALVGALLWLVDEIATGRLEDCLYWLAAALVFAAAGVRWGFPLLTTFGAGCLFGAMAPLDGARALFVIAGGAAVWGGLALEGSDAPPSQRQAGLGLQVVGALAVYLALHLGSWDAGLLDGRALLFHGSLSAQRTSALRPVFVAATAVLPLVYLGLGVALRRKVMLACGAAALLASLVTLRFYVHVAPLWVVLTGSGLALMAFAFALEWWLRAGADEERGGFTARPLEDERRQQVGEALVMAVQASQHPERPAPASPAFKGGGGTYGGGGATGEY
jgi:hypothetical protein